MCGIIGVVTKENNLKELLLNALHRLSYRGYDSAGLASVEKNSQIKIIKSIGDIESLEKKIESEDFCLFDNKTGIAHTRWATHGKVKIENTHPFLTDLVCVAHNGVIENFHDIKSWLLSEGFKFQSETDTELIPVLITKFLQEGAVKMLAIKKTLEILKGTFAISIIFKDEPAKLYGYKNGSPLIFSFSANKNVFCISSDIFSIALICDYFIKIDDGEIVIIDEEESFDGKNYEIFDLQTLNISKKEIKKVERLNLSSQSKEGFEHFMLKEIYEQPLVISETIGNFFNSANNEFLLEDMSKENIPHIMKIIGCGSSYIAANIGCSWLHKISLINSFSESASEARYSGDPIGIYDTMIYISQSGETADILAAVNEIKASCNKQIIAITNNSHSSLASISDVNIMTKAGQEISVASTKTFTTQMATLLILAIYFAKLKNLHDTQETQGFMNKVLSLPRKINDLLNNQIYLNQIKNIAKILSKQNNALFIGRGVYYHIASEGSLKLKEISYINSQSLFSGELKHGPLALIDKNSYIIAMCPENELYEKNIVSIEEILTRDANVIIITDTEKTINYFSSHENVFVIMINSENDSIISPFLFTITVQLLAYYTALELGQNIDKPRNLAKSVTVE